MMLVGHQGMAALLYRLLSNSCMIQLYPFLAPARSNCLTAMLCRQAS